MDLSQGLPVRSQSRRLLGPMDRLRYLFSRWDSTRRVKVKGGTFPREDILARAPLRRYNWKRGTQGLNSILVPGHTF